MKNVLFFSDRCEHSQALKQALSGAPFRKDVYYIDVENNRFGDLLDVLEVTQVPTLFVNGRMMVGDQAFDWLEDILHELSAGNHGQPAYGQTAPRAPPVMESYTPRQPAAPSMVTADEPDFDVQPLNGDASGGYSDFVPPGDDHAGGAQTRLPAPVHSRKNDKLDDGNMAQMLRQLEEERRSGIPLSLDEQRAQMTGRG